jgi:hypothetical protein
VSKPNACVSCCTFNHYSSWLYTDGGEGFSSVSLTNGVSGSSNLQAFLFSIANYPQGSPIFHTSARVLEFGFPKNLATNSF